MSDPAAAPLNPEEIKPEPIVLATKVCGVVKWFSVKSGYGFINTPSSNEDVFVHSKKIKFNNPRKLYKTLAEGETVEFDIMQGEKGNEAINVTGPDGKSVQGSQFAANKPKYGKRRSKESQEGKKKRKRKSRRNNRRGKQSDNASDNKAENIKKEGEAKVADESSSNKNTETKDNS